jgi:hypothetical protein
MSHVFKFLRAVLIVAAILAFALPLAAGDMRTLTALFASVTAICAAVLCGMMLAALMRREW